MINEKSLQIQESTIKDALSKLQEFGKCIIVRPPGFGKTKTSVNIMSYYDFIIFIYPRNNIRNTVSEYGIENCKLISYQKLVRGFNKTINEYRRYNDSTFLFVFDEAHFMGAQKGSNVIKRLMNEVCPKAHYLGMTATPERSDKINVINEFFEGIMCYDYNLKDAFEDDIFIKPKYVLCTLDDTSYQEILLKKISNSRISAKRKDYLLDRARTNVPVEKMNIKNLHLIIQKHIDDFKNDTGYYKFLCFFSTIDNLNNKKVEVILAFKKAFPSYNINVLQITSESNECRNNLYKLDRLVTRENTIDLILSINMLSFGYHVDNITGIMMLRATYSEIIYAQQLARCWSITAKTKTIIFDLVENAERIKSDNDCIFTNGGSLEDNRFLLPLESINLDDKTKEILEIERLIMRFSFDEIKDEVISAYKMGLVDLDYCTRKLNISNENFLSLV